MNLRHPFHTLVRLFRSGPIRRAIRKTIRARPRLELLEVRDTPTGSFTALANPLPDSGTGVGTMMLLPNGDVFAQRGIDPSIGFYNKLFTNQFYLLKPDAQGNYQAGTWSAAASMNTHRLYYGSNVRPDGTVFVVGGEDAGITDDQPFTNTAEIYNSLTNTWTVAAPFPLPNFGDDPTALLANGQIIAGNKGPYFGHNVGSTPGATFLYSPGSAGSPGSWAPTGTKFHANDSANEEAWVTLPDESVVSYAVFSSIVANKFEADRYFPAGLTLPGGGTSTGQWIDASTTSGTVPILSSPAVGYELGPALRLPDGRIFQLGANGKTAFYDPTILVDNSTNPPTYKYGTWSAGPNLPMVNDYLGVQKQLGAWDDPAALMPNGKILLALSPLKVDGTLDIRSYTEYSTYFYEFDPADNSFTPVTNLPSD